MGKKSDNIALIRQVEVACPEKGLPGNYALAYIQPFLQNNSNALIANVSTEALILKTSHASFPVTINNEEYDNSYVCSPYTACVSYVLEEMEKLKNKPLELLLSTISTCLGLLLKKATINKVACVNNWMLSTNLYPAWDGGEVSGIQALFEQEFPDHALMFRSLNTHSNAALLELFRKNNFILVPSRQVYIFDQNRSPYMKRNNTKIDIKALGKTDYEVVEHDNLQQSDYPRIVELYNLLYIKKYSKHNPQFTEKLIAHWHQNNVLTMTGLRNKSGVLDGVIGLFEVHGITSAPLVGYDIELPRRYALYRLLMALVIRHAHHEGLVLNLSSGAAGFKRLRGGEPFIEYSAVYIKHLPWFKRFVWKLTNFLLTHLGVPIMKAFKL